MAYQVYTVTLPENPEALMFIQGIVARNLAGALWMWRNVLWIKKSNANAEGWSRLKRESATSMKWCWRAIGKTRVV